MVALPSPSRLLGRPFWPIVCFLLITAFLVSYHPLRSSHVLHHYYGTDSSPVGATSAGNAGTYSWWHSIFRPSQSTSSFNEADPSVYTPGTIGTHLVDLHRKYLADTGNPERWLGLLDDTHIPSDLGMFDLMADRNESACAGWEIPAGRVVDSDLIKRDLDERWKDCWRAKMWSQLEKLDEGDWPWALRFLPTIAHRNRQAINRLKRCLAQPFTRVHPTFSPRSQPAIPGGGSWEDIDESDTWLEDRECSWTSTKVIVGHWWYITLAFGTNGNAGETVWMRSYIDALEELGYTFLALDGYEGMIQVHKVIPDVISQFWLEDKHTLSCQGDPQCSKWEDFKPSQETYPELKIDDKGEPIWEHGSPRDASTEDPRQKWVWTRSELDAIPVEKRGTIPTWKLFTPTYWGARPGDPYWGFESQHEFSWNEFGQQWTLTPFEYPHHTYIPYSIESYCLNTTYYPAPEREDRLFVLAKRIAYFLDPSDGKYIVPPEYWAEVKDETGLSVISVAADDDPPTGKQVPKGVHTVGRVDQHTFEELVARSKLMLGIGRPNISPSVYSALCQGTPVVVPYYGPEPVPSGWDLFNGALAQHGPAAAIGPPYVYSYKAGNTTMLAEKIREAAANPIGRYIPESMTTAANLRHAEDVARFNWKRHAQVIKQAGDISHSDIRRKVIGRCFEIGRCVPLPNPNQW